MTKPHDTPDRLTAKEREDYSSGRWTLDRKTPVKRKTPLKRKRTTPRKVKLPLFTCTKHGCDKPIRFFGQWCALHARKEADRIFSLYIRKRDQVCQASMGGVLCGLPYDLQCAHLISRRYFALRWNPENAVALCTFHHKKWTEDPLGWDDWCAEHVGAEDWEAMKFRAQRGGMPDLGIVIEDIRALTKELAA